MRNKNNENDKDNENNEDSEDNENNEIRDEEIHKKENKEGNIITFENIIRKIYIKKVQSFNNASSNYNKNDRISKSKCLII